MKFIIEHNKLKEQFGKLCPCIVPTRKTAIQENLCPCKQFVLTGHCVCELFKCLEEKNANTKKE